MIAEIERLERELSRTGVSRKAGAKAGRASKNARSVWTITTRIEA